MRASLAYMLVVTHSLVIYTDELLVQTISDILTCLSLLFFFFSGKDVFAQRYQIVGHY